ncbi:MAG TPA: hypothetical protein VMU14_22865 [Acidimicrobiales bacterium]|nr:hypothetical protein [Acidimicrobiales bacterium]
MTRAEEIRAAGGLAAGAVSSTIILISDVHEAIIRGVERRLPPPARVLTRLNSAAARGTYAVVDTVVELGLQAGAQLVPRRAAPTPSRTGVAGGTGRPERDP